MRGFGRCEASAIALHFAWEQCSSSSVWFCATALFPRYLDATLCTVSACADYCVAEFSAARLRLEQVSKAYVLRAPGALGHSPLAATSFITQMGRVLRAAGVRCDLTEKGISGKPTVTHHFKKYALNHAALVG